MRQTTSVFAIIVYMTQHTQTFNYSQESWYFTVEVINTDRLWLSLHGSGGYLTFT